ncbi:MULTISPECIES: ParA family protein [unclassified Caballeronia]|uniref:ParA family protein n=1 Tax=unclassified Caballeronia TaxID=2646786 RepID=UPI0020279B76|nr:MULTISPECIES: ParA family protein [unclassified Caballeronia]MDR5765842.1 ParA family protein [Caballeronia sp. LZ028]
MPVLVIANTKGGVGRTTLAVELAVGLEFRRGGQVVLADLCQQQAVRHWWQDRSAPTPQLLEESSADGLRRWLTGDAMSGGAWLVVDTPSHYPDVTAAAIALADFVLIPVRDCGMELPGAIDTAKECARLNKRFAFVLTRVDTSSETLLWVLQLMKHGPILEAYVRHLQEFCRLDRAGLSVFDLGGGKAARDDMLWVVECLLDEFPAEKRFALKAESDRDIRTYRRWAQRSSHMFCEQ